MPHVRFGFVALSLSALIAATPGHARDLSGPLATPETANRLEQKLQRIITAGAPAAIAFIRDGTRRWIAAKGVADIKTRRLAKVTDAWRIASVTKLVSAHFGSRLQAEGLLDLNAPLSRISPHLPNALGQVTVAQLLNHTSRLAEYLDHRVLGVTARGMAASARRRPDIDALVTRALRSPRVDDPMAEHQYANTNYALFEHIIEQASGQSFEALMTSRIIEPLQLTHTGLTDREGRIPVPHLRTYIRDDTRVGGPFSSRNRLLDVTEHPYFRGADGGLYASAGDLAKLMDAIWDAERAGKRPLGQLTERLYSDHDGFYRYGLGVMAVLLSCGKTIYGHEGQDLGGSTVAFANRENTRQLVLGVNLSTDNNAALTRAIESFRETVFCS
ncbi:MAG: serine hydrolase domain-containing protein [Pseudomonadota bacterium]